MWIYDDDYDDNVGDGRLCALCAETKILTETETETFSPTLNFWRPNRDFFSRLNFLKVIPRLFLPRTVLKQH